VSIPDDDQFEKYLKQFRPVAGEPLMVKEKAEARSRPLVFAACAAVAAAIVLAVVMSVLVHKPTQPPGPTEEASTTRVSMEEFGNPPPLTIASANALLESAPSFKAAIDNMAFQQESKPISEGRYSLLALLSKEDVKQ
jgi:hypothetical protein